MTQTFMSSEDLLLGANARYSLEVPQEVLYPGPEQKPSADDQPMFVHLQPLTVGTFQLIMKAAKQDPALIPLLMIKESMVEPQLSLAQVKQMHLGLVEFLISRIRQISGLGEKKSS